MKKISIYAVAGLLLLLMLTLGISGCKEVIVEPTVDIRNIHSLAVLPFENNTRYSGVGERVTDSVIISLVQNIKEFQIVERARIYDVLQEQEMMTAQGVRVVAKGSAQEIGRLLEVNTLLVGTVNSLSISNVITEKSYYDEKKGIQYYSASKTGDICISARLIDVATGAIKWGTEEAASVGTYDSYKSGEGYQLDSDDQLIDNLVRSVARKIAENFYPHKEYTLGF